MRFSYEYKLECVESYRSGIYPETPEGISETCFRSKVRQWSRVNGACHHKLSDIAFTTSASNSPKLLYPKPSYNNLL